MSECFRCKSNVIGYTHYVIDYGTERAYTLCSDCYISPSKREENKIAENKRAELVKRGYVKEGTIF